MPVPNGRGPTRRQFLAPQRDPRCRHAGTRRVPRRVFAFDAVVVGAQPHAGGPGQPRHVGYRGGQQADRRRSRTGEGHTSALQLRRLCQPRRGEVVRGQVRRARCRSRRSTTPTRRSPRSAAATSNTTSTSPATTRSAGWWRANLIRPLNHSYIPDISNVWPSFTNPWYDQEWRFTVPYTIYTAGIGWRNDQVPADIGALPNPYDSLWDPDYKGKTAVLDDWHTAMAMVLLRQGITDVNTSSADRPEDGRRATQRVGGRDVAEGHHHHVQRPARRPDRARLRCGRATSSTPSPICRRAPATEMLRYWFPAGRQGAGGQRPDGRAAQR